MNEDNWQTEQQYSLVMTIFFLIANPEHFFFSPVCKLFAILLFYYILGRMKAFIVVTPYPISVVTFFFFSQTTHIHSVWYNSFIVDSYGCLQY